MAIKKGYDKESISVLTGMEGIRHNPGMYIGSTGSDGLHHVLLEVISNSIDEFLEGTCTEINIEINNENFIKVTDNGRGIPFGLRPDGTETLESLVTKLHAGAKFSSDGSTGYNSSGGMHGVGLKAANALSDYFQIISHRDNKIAELTCSKGVKKSFITEDENHHQVRGTTVIFRPDITIFKDGIEIDRKRLTKQLEELSFLCSGLTIFLKYKDYDSITIQTKDGMTDYVKSLTDVNKRITNIFQAELAEERYSISFALCYVSGFAEITKLYVNNIPNTGGSHLTGFRSAMTRTVNDLAREKNLLKEKDKNLTGEDLKEGLVLTLSLRMPDPVFNGQTKDVLTSSEGRTIVEKLAATELREWFTSNPNELKTIVNKALTSKKARDAAKRARELVRGKSKKVLNSHLQGKLTDCISKNSDITELFIVEGDSAGGGVKTARDKQTQAVLPMQGKILNAEKNDLSSLLKNKEIQALIASIGCGIGKDFDIEKVRYKKIIIMADADVDGQMWACEKLFA